MGVSQLMAQVLFNRGLTDPGDARIFLDPQLKALPDPRLLSGAEQAAELIARKARDRRRIVIYGDYDVDGITGTAILWHLLTLAGADVGYYIPHRLEEGYGLNSDALRQLAREGADTVITVDCGITAVEPAKVAHELGLTLVITDHHAPGSGLPECDGMVHPRIGDGYPNPDLAGAGVAFKLAWAVARALCGSEKVTSRYRDFLVDATGLAALGTIADVVPLRGENRILTRFGLLGLAESKLPGLRALIAVSRLADQKLSSEHVGFWLAPRLNAAGRMGHAHQAVELLTHADEARAAEVAAFLEQQNRDRQATERRLLDEACEQIVSRRLASDARRGIVLASENWHAGVIGIVASRIVERFGRPTVLIALEGEEGQGSGRSIPGFDLHRALGDCASYLTTCGGHAMAAGLRIARAQVEAFTEAFVARANNLLTARDLEPALHLDAEVSLGELTEPLVHDLARLRPFGCGNPKPKFASAWLDLDGEPRLVGSAGTHLAFSLRDGQTRRRAIAFGQKERFEPLLEHRRCRVAFEPKLNTFNGHTSVELCVVDMMFPGKGEGETEG
ncbi:MAG: single-stranded-DNA-specific exonuclease RecJ [Phycisphaerae bacterium]|nr:single-stranded-DNA-specific exonuclease RecJ [Phycisphaerae bacterium]